MSLPAHQDLLRLFSAFLFEAGLSSVSVKNYLSDIRHFLAFCSHSTSIEDTDSIRDIFQSISKYVNLYTEDQKANYVPLNTINRRLASVRRFSTFLKTTFDIKENGLSQNASPFSLKSSTSKEKPSYTLSDSSNPDPFKKILSQFKSYLDKEKKTHSTVKNYISDVNHFVIWSANQTPFTSQDLERIVSQNQLSAYTTYEKLSHTSTSVINRRYSSIKKFAQFAFDNNYLPSNPFERKVSSVRLAPLAWLERLSNKGGDKNRDQKPSRIKTLYKRYNSLPFTPYLHLAILVLATSAMAIFAYNQIITSAFPSQAASLPPVVPNRMLSFQGRLTDSSSTPITTGVTLIFRLYDQLSGGSLLYTTTPTCPVVPDQNGIFNTNIGDGTCGSAIPSTVFSQNRDVFVEIQVAAETLTPRQQIATVGYALNSDTLQGYPASASATINTVPVMNNDGNIVLAQLNPSLIATSSSGTFTVKGDTLSLQTTAGSGGNIILQPGAASGGNVQILTDNNVGNQFRVQNANLTTGALISGYIGNNNDAPGLLVLSSGASEAEKFAVRADGQTRITTDNTLVNAALMVDQVGTGDIFTASQSGTTRVRIGNSGNITSTSTITASAATYTSLFPVLQAGDGGYGMSADGGTTYLFGSNQGFQFRLADLTNLLRILPTGEVGIGITNPTEKLQVVGNVQFSGALMPGGAAGTTGQVLTSAGTGTAPTWSALSAINFWQRNSGAISPLELTNPLNLGATATNSATVHLAGTTGDNSFVNTGNFGIGLTNPVEKLDVNGGIKLAMTTNTNSGTLRYTTNNGLEIFDGTYWSVLNTAHLTKEITGFVDRTTTTLSYVDGTRTFTITGSNFPIYLKSEEFLKSTESIVIANTVGLHFVYYNAAGTLVESTTPWDLSITVPIATVYWNGSVGLIGDERHGVTMDYATHQYLHNTVGSRYSDGLAGTFTNTTFSVTAGSFFDEDLRHTTAVPTTTARVLYRIPAATSFTYTALQAPVYTASTGVLDYDNAGTRTAVGNNDYVAYWIFATNDSNSPIYSLMGQRSDTTLTNARNNALYTSLSLANLPFSEMKILYRVLYRNQGGTATFIEAEDLRNISNLPSGTFLATSHGTLSGLGNDDHTQYALLAGRAGSQFLNGGSAANETLTIAGNSSATGNTLTNANLIFKVGDAGGTTAMTILNNGRVGIGITNPGYELDVVGSINASTALCIAGDCRTNWASVTSENFWSYNTGVLTPVAPTNAVNLGNVATASATVHLPGVATDNAFINAGNVGIGTTSPNSKLQVQNTSSNGTIVNSIRVNQNGTGTNTGSSIALGYGDGSSMSTLAGINGYFDGTGPALGLFTGASNTQQLTIINSGEVGIGVTNPAVALEIGGAGNVRIGGLTASMPVKTDASKNLISAAINIATGDITGILPLANGGTNKNMTPVAGGVVWTDADSMEVTVAGVAGQFLTSNGAGAPTWTSAGTNFWQRNDGVLSPINITDDINLGATATASATVHLAGTTGEESFINGGNFGIGTTNPLALLSVGTPGITNAAIPVQIATGGAGTDQYYGVNVGASYGTLFGYTNGNAGITGSPVGGVIRQVDANPLLFVMGNTNERMRLTTDGYLGIGTTAPNKQLQVLGTGQLTAALTDAGNSGGTINISQNVGTAGAGGALLFSALNDNGSYLPQAAIKSLMSNGTSNGIGDLAFSTRNAVSDVALTERMRILSGGNVGIGVTNPASKVAVLPENVNNNQQFLISGSQPVADLNDITLGFNSYGTVGSPTRINGSYNAWGIAGRTYTADANASLYFNFTTVGGTNYTPIQILGGSSAAASIITLQQSGGNVGIGITNPAGPLHVTSNSTTRTNIFLSNTDNVAGEEISAIKFRALDSTSAVHDYSALVGLISSPTDGAEVGQLNFETSVAGSGDTRMTIKGANVGIGTTTPTYPLTLSKDGTNISGNMYGVSIHTDTAQTKGVILGYDNSSTTGIIAPFNVSSNLAFWTHNGTSWAERMGILSNGNVGIGITNPGSKLSVLTGLGVGSGAYVTGTAPSNGAIIEGNVGIGTTSPSTYLASTSGLSVYHATVPGVGIANASNQWLWYGTGTSLRLYESTGPADRISILTGGNVGIGTTSPGSRLDIQESNAFVGNATGIRLYNASTGDTTISFRNSATEWGAGMDNSDGDKFKISNFTGTGDYSATGITIDTNGNVGIGLTNPGDKLVVAGNLSPSADNTYDLGSSSANNWKSLWLADGIYNNAGTATVIFGTPNRLGQGDWRVANGSNSKLYVGSAGGAGEILFDPDTAVNNGTITVGSAGDGKINVGTVDPPYTIYDSAGNPQKYSTYLPGMIGIKEEVAGKLTTDEYIDGVGYRKVLDLAHQEEGSDLWVFAKTTDLNRNIGELSILLTAQSQARTWYEINNNTKVLAIYSSAPTDISFRMTAPRFDNYKWKTYTPDRTFAGHIVNISDSAIIPDATKLSTEAAKIVLDINGKYIISRNGQQNLEQGSFVKALVANFEAGIATITEIVADNIQVKNIIVSEKLISPLADIETLNTTKLTAKEATVSGTLYADNIQSNTVDVLSNKISVIGDNYATASAILADLQSKYNNYNSLVSPLASASSDLLAFDPLLTPTASIPADLVLKTLQVTILTSNDLLVNGSLIANSINSNNSDLYIQPDASRPVHILGNLMTLLPTGKVVIINGDLQLNGTLYANGIDSNTATISGQLAIGTSETTNANEDKLIALYGNQGNLVSSVDASGSANFSQVATNELVIAAGNDVITSTSSASTNSNATIGTAIMSANQTELFIQNTKIDSNTLVYLTPVSDTQNQVLFVKSKEDGVGFTVSVNTPTIKDIQFNYWLVKTK